MRSTRWISNGMSTAGYSGKPLATKLGIKPDWRLLPRHAPENYLDLLGTLPAGVEILQRPSGRLDLVHLFATETKVLARDSRYRHKIAENGADLGLVAEKAAKCRRM